MSLACLYLLKYDQSVSQRKSLRRHFLKRNNFIKNNLSCFNFHRPSNRSLHLIFYLGARLWTTMEMSSYVGELDRRPCSSRDRQCPTLPPAKFSRHACPTILLRYLSPFPKLDDLGLQSLWSVDSMLLKCFELFKIDVVNLTIHDKFEWQRIE